MAVGDPGADAYGNTTVLSSAQQQYYINLALSLGASRADIDSFIHNNGYNDLGRIVSALGLSPTAKPSSSPGAGTGTLSYSSAVISSPNTGIDPRGPAPSANSYAQPSANLPLTQSSAADGRIAGNVAGSSPDVNVSVTSPAGAAAVLPAPSVPTWAIVLGAAILVFLFLERK